MKKKKQTDPYGDTLISVLERLDPSAFHVHFHPPKIFICGGKSDPNSVVPQSLRERLLRYFAKNDETLYDSCVQAEEFKDYFKDDVYTDLLAFEDDIALFSTLIIICLESPGSLVELGMFCNREHARKRILVIAPQQEVAGEDSFIYLGPLKSLLKNDETSVLIYPWPNPAEIKYEHVEVIYEDIKSKLRKIEKSAQFNLDNNAHIAFLIYEITRFAYPIKISEIELALSALDIDVDQKKIVRLLYLLEVMGLISKHKYSITTYYYAAADGDRRVTFGKTKDGKISDQPSMTMSLRQSYILESDEVSRKRFNALKQIQEEQKKAKT